MTLGMPLIKC